MNELIVAELLQRDLKRLDKLLIILGVVDSAMMVAEIKDSARAHGCRNIQSWNVSSILSLSKGKAVLLPSGWSITSVGKAHLVENGLLATPSITPVVSDLRNHIEMVSDATTRAFVLEAIGCFEQGFFRSAIVMSWISAIDLLQTYVTANKLAEFNAEAKRVNSRWKDAVNYDGLSKMGEEVFLIRVGSSCFIG